MHSSLRAALYGSDNNRSSRQDETISELEEYLKEGQDPNARDGSATSLLELCIDFKSKLNKYLRYNFTSMICVNVCVWVCPQIITYDVSLCE